MVGMKKGCVAARHVSCDIQSSPIEQAVRPKRADRTLSAVPPDSSPRLGPETHQHPHLLESGEPVPGPTADAESHINVPHLEPNMIFSIRNIFNLSRFTTVNVGYMMCTCTARALLGPRSSPAPIYFYMFSNRHDDFHIKPPARHAPPRQARRAPYVYRPHFFLAHGPSSLSCGSRSSRRGRGRGGVGVVAAALPARLPSAPRTAAFFHPFITFQTTNKKQNKGETNWKIGPRSALQTLFDRLCQIKTLWNPADIPLERAPTEFRTSPKNVTKNVGLRINRDIKYDDLQCAY